MLKTLQFKGFVGRAWVPVALIGASIYACQPANAATASPGTIFYTFDKGGAGNTIRLLSVNPANNSSPSVVANTGVVAETGTNPFTLNGFAWDPSSRGVYFVQGSSAGARNLYFTSVVSGSTLFLGNLGTGGLGVCSTGALGCASSGTAGNFNNGAFLGGKYYSIVSSTNTLFSIDIPKAGGQPVAFGGSPTTSFLPLTGVPSGAYGDIAFQDANTLIGVQQSGVSWKYSFTSSTGSTLTTPCSGDNCNLQIGFNSNKSVLYGVNSTTGNWYIINTTSGARTSVGTLVPGITSSDPLFDLTDVANVPGPLPILGAAAAFGASRKMRKRIQESRTAPANA